MPLSEKELLERDAKRDIGAELLEAIRQVKAGSIGRVHRVPVTWPNAPEQGGDPSK